MTYKVVKYALIIGILLFFTNTLSAQVPKPSDVFGFKPGADYKIASYQQLLNYYNKVNAASDRIKMVHIGKTTNGRPMILLIISSKQNLQRLDHWRMISSKIAHARIDSEQARKYSLQGKPVIWVDAGLHASELAPGQMMPLLLYRLATKDTPEMHKIRKNVIIVLMPMMNPDGLAMVRSWYYAHLDTKYEKSSLPWLWQEYVGHDNNRDYLMGNMQETKNILKVLYHQWFPQIVYNQHQSSPRWTRIFIPPFRSPVNQHIQPGVTAGVNEVGSAMMNRFAIKHMPGAISGVDFTMYWNGGMREIPYYHNMIGILSEAAQPSPTPRYYDPKKKPKKIRGLLTDSTSIFYPYPWNGGWLHFRDAVNYCYTGAMAVLDYSADRHTNLLYNIYSMGRHAINEGKAGGPYAYVIPKKQWDHWEAKNLVNVLYRGGVEVKQATSDFTAGGKHYQAGSYIVYAGQAFRPYVMDLLDVQYYPTVKQYPGGPPRRPYDITGWTLPMQMSVNLSRINKSFKVSTKTITGLINPLPGQLFGNGSYGYLLGDKSNVTAKVVNQLLASGAKVARTKSEINHSGKKFLAGSYVIQRADVEALKDIVKKYGVNIYGLSSKPGIQTSEIKLPKVGLYKSWDAVDNAGWTRWLLQKQYGFRVDTLHHANIMKKDLSQYQSIIIPAQSPFRILHGKINKDTPKKYEKGLETTGVKRLKEYTKDGGTLIAFDRASDFLIKQFDLPLKDVTKGLSSKKFYIPGTLIRTSIATDKPLAWGMPDTVAVFFEKSHAFRLESDNINVVARYGDDTSNLLMSGWMLGGKYIAGRPAMVRLSYGKGQIILFAFKPQFRGESRGTYKLIFNALYGSTIEKYPDSNKSMK